MVFELAGGQNDPVSPLRFKNTLDFDPILDGEGANLQLRNRQVQEAETLSLLVLTYNTPFQIVFDHLGLRCCHGNAISERH